MNRPRSQPDLIAFAYMVLSVTSFSLSGFFAAPAIKGFGFWCTLLARFTLPLFIVVAARRGAVLRERLLVDPAHLMRALALVASQGLFFVTSASAGLFLAIVLYNTGPLFLVLIESIYYRRRPTRLTLFGLFAGFAGTLLIIHTSFAVDVRYIALGLLSGVAFAISQFTLYLGSKKYDNLTMLYYTYFWSTLFALGACLICSPDFHLPVSVTPYNSIAIVAVGLFSFLNQSFRGIAYRLCDSVSMLGPAIYIGVLVSFLLDLSSSRVIPPEGVIIGALLILGGVVFPRVVPAFGSVFFRKAS